MGAGNRIGGFFLFAAMGGLGGIGIYDYATSPAIKDVELIRQSALDLNIRSSEIKSGQATYQTAPSSIEDSVVPLDQTLTKLNVVRQDNPDKTEDIDKLIMEISQIRDDRETVADPLLYRFALAGLAKDLNDYANTNKEGGLLALGILGGLVSLVGLGKLIFDC
jgi:hypothetical protein